MGLTGFHSMRKEQLVRALLKASKANLAGSGNSKGRGKSRKKSATSSGRVKVRVAKSSSNRSTASSKSGRNARVLFEPADRA